MRKEVEQGLEEVGALSQEFDLVLELCKVPLTVLSREVL